MYLITNNKYSVRQTNIVFETFMPITSKHLVDGNIDFSVQLKDVSSIVQILGNKQIFSQKTVFFRK